MTLAADAECGSERNGFDHFGVRSRGVYPMADLENGDSSTVNKSGNCLDLVESPR